MIKKEIKYGLYHIEKQKILGYEITSNEGQAFCNEESCSLTHYSDNEWFTEDPRIAEWVRVFNVQWYNSDYNCPMCDYKSYELKVVKVEIQTTITDIDVSIPTIYEFYKAKYETKSPRHWQSLKEHIDEMTAYSVHELDGIDF